MSLKKIRDKMKPKKNIFSEIIEKYLKIIFISIITIFVISIFIMGYIYYKNEKKLKNITLFEEISNSYNDLSVKDNKNDLKKILPQISNLLNKTVDNNIRDLSLLYMGNILIDLKNYKEAIKYYDKFLRNSSDPYFLIVSNFNNGLAYEELKSYSDAIRYFTKALQISHPNYLEKDINMALARCYEKTGKIEEAKTIYRGLTDSEEASFRLMNLP